MFPTRPLCSELVKINTAIIGGIVLDVGEKTIDLSVASRLNKFDGALNC
jgi:F-type H+-transporting ATPase subunit O